MLYAGAIRYGQPVEVVGASIGPNTPSGPRNNRIAGLRLRR